MSSAANWSYTAKATLWVLQSRAAWGGGLTFDAPVSIACDYSVESKRATDSKGDEFTTSLILYTERADIKQGDRVALGESSAVDPIAAGALEVRAIKRDADTHDRVADDYQVMS